MGVCPNCDKPVDDDAMKCPDCGGALPSNAFATLDADAFPTASGVTVSESQPVYPASEEVDQAPSIVDPNSVYARSHDGPPNQAAETRDQQGFTTQQSSPQQCTPQTSEEPIGAAQGHEGQHLDEPSIRQQVDGTLEISELRQPSETMPDSRPLPLTMCNLDATVDSVDLPAGMEATLQEMPFAGKTTDATQNFGDEAAASSERASLASGTAGRLQRIWGGVAGSKQNPMQTIKGDEALATDSVFAKVARRVLVADPNANLTQNSGTTTSIPSAAQQRARDCIETVCQGSNDKAADYDLTGFLGQGGMGVVLKAQQRGIGRDVAIKMIQPSAGKSTIANSNAQKKKFFYEAQITGKLDHPNIVPIYELGVCNEVLFYSMKMIIGKEWKDVIGRKQRDENLDIFTKVADAMAFAHQKQIIHRDLKPENVMIGPFGEVLVTDWGCAVDMSRNEKFTGAGSPPWMAPEMAEHDVRKIGPRSDIYLLGAILYQVVTGYPPHPGQTVFECIAAAQKNVIIDPRIEDPLLEIAYRAMETAPDDRFHSVEEMQAAIREYRRHAESIQLSDRSEGLLAQAIESKDYERFSRTIFGFQDAVELWPGNTTAKSGLAAARLAYGQCAFDRGDYDLCLQSLDESIPAEAGLVDKATKARHAARERENRFRALRKVLAAVILVGLGVTSILATVAWLQRQKAVVNALQAIASADEATTARGLAEVARDEARSARDTADLRAEEARQAGADAMQARDAEVTARELAENRAAQVELEKYQSKIALALGQVLQRDVASANESLNQLVDAGSYEALGKQGRQPRFDNWALNRVKLLTNSELLIPQFYRGVTGINFARDANRGVVAADDGVAGKLLIIELKDNRLQVVRSITTPGRVDSVGISPDGEELVYSLAASGTKNTGSPQGGIFQLDLGSPNSQPVKVIRESNAKLPTAASMQSLLITDKSVVGGINGGLWVWPRTNGWPNTQPLQVPSLRGLPRSMQQIEDGQVLILAELNGQLDVHLVNLDPGQPSSSRVDIKNSTPVGFAAEQLSAVAFANGKLIVGTQSGRMFTAELLQDGQSVQVGPEFTEILPQQHRSAIQSISVHDDGLRMLSTADEPVINVWTRGKERSSDWQLETELIGTPENISSASFSDSQDLVLGMGADGSAIAWDIPRQQQRKKLQRYDLLGNMLNYDSPVIKVVATSDNSRAVSIHRDGTLDEWDLITGRTIIRSHGADGPEASDASLAYVGHSPNARFVDFEVDADAGIMITSAMLPVVNSRKQLESRELVPASLQSKSDSWEICKWNMRTGKMLDRWTVQSDTRQEVSLISRAELILYASHDSTLIKQAKRFGDAKFLNNTLGSYFAVSHPQQPNLILSVKSNGAVRIVDTGAVDGGLSQPGYRIDYSLAENSGLLSVDEQPLVGQWSPDGSRFYLFWESGRITELVWENATLQIGRDLRDEQLRSLGVALTMPAKDGAKSTYIRLSSPWQVDMKVRSHSGYNLLYLGLRFPGSGGRTRLERVAFPIGEGAVTAEKDDQILSRQGLLTDHETPRVAPLPKSWDAVSDHLVVATSTIGEKSFLVNELGNVYEFLGEQLVRTYGRPETLAGTGNAEANKIVTLHQGGVLWRADLLNDRWSWSPLSRAPAQATDIAMSPDGSKLLVSLADPEKPPQLLILDSESGEQLELIDQSHCGVWAESGDLSYVTTDGKVQWRTEQATFELGQLTQDAHPRSVHVFTEMFADLPPKTWVIILSDRTEASNASIQYFQAKLGANIQQDWTPRVADLPGGMRILACASSGNIFASGGRGTVQIHFAAPTLGQLGADPLFGFDAHAGAQIESLTFTPDGNTLISSDDVGRLFAWLSTDPLVGFSATAEQP